MGEAAEQGQKQEVVFTQDEEAVVQNIIERGTRSFTSGQKAEANKQLQELVRELLRGTLRLGEDFEKSVNDRIAEIDRLVTLQVNEVMHTLEFQKLEASWRGLHYLVDQSETGPMLKIRVLNVSKKDLYKNLKDAVEFDQSTLFKKVYEEEFGQLGGEPFGVLIGDYEFAPHPQDIDFLDRISIVAAAAHAPFIAAAHPYLFGVDNFTEINRPRDLATFFSQAKDAAYIKWRSFRNTPDSRYVGLVLPHVLMREPYGPDTVPVEGFDFREDVDGKDHHKYLWGNAAYAFASRLTAAFAKHNWCVAIRGLEGGGLVEKLPLHTFPTDQGDVALKCPTEVAIPDRREVEFADLGFIPLLHCKGTDYAAFLSAQSCRKPEKWSTDEANASENLSTQLQYTFAVTRIAHYLKAICTAKVGTFMTAQNCQDYLNKWIANYVLLDDDAGQDLKAEKPLRDARIEVKDVPGKPGWYQAVAYLRPHFQLDRITTSLRLVANVPQ